LGVTFKKKYLCVYMLAAEILILCLMIVFLLGLIYVIACVTEQGKHNQALQDAVKEEFAIELTPNEDLSIVFLAPVRNAMQGLPYFQANLKKVKRAYPNTRVVFLENDSNDETLDYISTQFDFLESEVLHPSNVGLNNKVLRGISCERIDRMCKLRNELLNHAGKADIYIPVDADWPVVWKIHDFQRAIDYLQSHEEVNAVSPLFLAYVHFCPFWKTYYDTFAFSDSKWDNPIENQSQKFELKFNKWSKEEELDVNSAFGTMAMYKRPLDTILYEAMETESGNCRCEHVSYNQQIGKMKLLTWFQIIA